MADLKTATGLVHSDYVSPAPFGSLTTPIHHASTVTFPTVAALRARDWRSDDIYTYGLAGTPTTYTLEHRLAEIEGGTHCLVTPSGLAAITLVDLALLKSGDEVLLPDNVYNPSRELGESLLRGFGVTARYYDPLIGAGIAALMNEHTRLLWLEAPGSITMEVPDIPALVAAAKARGVTTAIDNTWAAGLLLRPFDFGIDISMQALTKYQSGGSDVLMGAVITRDRALHERLKLAHMHIGFGVGGDDSYLLLRGLPSMQVRLRQHEQSALAVAQWLKARPEITRVLHPALPDCPGHEFWKRDFKGASGLFSVIFDARFGQERVDAFIDGLKLFRIGYSWGGAASLAVPYNLRSIRTATPWSDPGRLVRFYIGLEDAGDLIADLERSMATALA